MLHLTLSQADHQLLRLRFHCHWPLRRIARHLGVSPATISRRITRIHQRHGLARPHRPNPKRRTFRVISLSDAFNV